MDGRRIFIALDISDATRAACAAHIEVLRRQFPEVRVGWEKEQKLHITLKFIGNVSERLLDDLRAAIASVSGSAFAMRLSPAGVFPSPKRPRVLWIGIDDDTKAVHKLHAGVERACSELGIEPEAKQFHPHITIGRVREPERAKNLADVHMQTNIEPVEFEVSEIVIYESVLKPTGSEYSALSRVKLLGS